MKLLQNTDTTNHALHLRDYQTNAVDAIKNFSGYGGLIVLPVGAGKSLVIAELCKVCRGSVLVLAHRQELIQQNSDEFYNHTKDEFGVGEEFGIWSASLNQKTKKRVTFAQIQSAYREPWQVDLIIIDEVHLLPPKDTSMYQQILKNDHKQLIGLTATPHRLDVGHLCRGENPLFSKVVYEAKYDELVEQGYLSSLVYKQNDGVVNSDFNIQAGEIKLSQVEEKLDKKLETILVDALSKKKGKALWFCPTVNIANQVARAIGGEVITAETENRDIIIDSFKKGQIKDLVNVDVLTTGFNVPDIETLIFLRPTTSTALFKQMLGRGTRLADNKISCHVLDYTTNTLVHGFLGDDNYPNGKGVSKDYRVCPNCAEINKYKEIYCTCCEYEFPKIERVKSNPIKNLKTFIFETDKEYVLKVESIYAEMYFNTFNEKYSIKISIKTSAGTIYKYLPIMGYYKRIFLAKLGLKQAETVMKDIDNINKLLELPKNVIVAKPDKWISFVDFS